jgi:hypothetical protein
MNKPSHYFLSAFVLVLVGFAHDIFAQGFIPVTQQINTPYGNVPHTYYVPTGMGYYYNRGNISYKYEFTVILKNDDKLTFKSKIGLSDSIHSLTYKEAGEKRKILPLDTKEVFRFTTSGKRITGIPTDSCWLFKVVEGKINGYSFLATEGAEHLSAFQVGDGEILPLTKDNLMPIVLDDPRRVKWVERGKLGKVIADFNRE